MQRGGTKKVRKTTGKTSNMQYTHREGKAAGKTERRYERKR